MKNVFKSYSSLSTKLFAEQFAEEITRIGVMKKMREGALVIALSGELGAGKTTFTQGFAKGLGLKRRMMSPTFVLMRRFALRKSKFKNIYHLDAYRIKDADSLEVFGLQDIFSHSQNIVLIEWPEKIKKILPKGVVMLKFKHGKKEGERTISFRV
jgi:tRNA threonylcarbamoyladenosine biosynthesis protein TsaE